jgi:alanyl-tRNA synthetase
MEIWNLVFMQFDRGPGGVDTPLPAPSIDTGAGLERIAALLQGVGTSFHIDTFRPIIQTAEDALEREYSFAPEDWEAGLPFRVLADHARAVAFLLADGVFPSNEKRGYVLRRILRRAVRHYWLLGRREPMLDSLVGVVAEGMRDTYPELDSRREHLLATTRSEEELFLDTIEGGMAEIDLAMPERVHGAEPRKPERSGPIVISGATVFKLKDTYGIPEDLTGVIADERGYEVDWEGFETALEEQRRRSRAAAEGAAIIAARTGTPLVAEGQQEFVGYDRVECESAILVVRRLEDGYEMVLERNPFYAESGGQVSDRGWIRGEDWTIEVTGVYKNDGGQTVVAGPLSGGALPPDPELVTASVHTVLRRDTERNHTATHLLHAALRELLGEHVQQAGSLVAPDRLRFDFSHRGPLTSAERDAIEQRVNERILANLDVTATERDYGEALAEGAMALFGEKYGDVVRVIDVPGISIELCGGTHVRTTGQIGSFRILSETGVAAGIRRIEAISGTEAYRRAVRQDLLIADLAARLRVPVAELPTRLDRLLDELDELERDAVGRRGAAAADQVQRLIDDTPRDGARFLSGRIEVPAGTDLGELGDLLRERLGSGAAILHVVYPDEDRHAFLSVVSDDLVRDGIKAGDLVRVSSKATGSGGGGRPHFAHGGVGDPEQADAGLVAARDWVSERAPNLVG